MEMSKVESFQERLFVELNGGLSSLNLQLGFRLGLIQALADGRAFSPAELALEVRCSERYIREWLECMTAGEYLEYDPITGRFSLPAEHAAVLTDPSNPQSAIGVIGWITSLANILPDLIDAFQSGNGIPYASYGMDMISAQGMSTRPMFTNDYVNSWIPAMPDIEKKFRNGGKVAEVGCGVGWSSIALAKGLSNTIIDAIDPDELSIVEAKRNAEKEGVADRITFHISTIEETELEGPYDLITAFECLHDMPYPVEALSRMRELLTPDGAVLIADEAVGDTLEENTNFMGHFFYNFSVLHCLPQALVFPDSAGTGTVIKPSILRRYAEDAGFGNVDVLPIENPQFRFYRINL